MFLDNPGTPNLIKKALAWKERVIMKKLYGAYAWNYVGNENKVEGVKENHTYIVCVEKPASSGSEWHMVMTMWFEKGAGLDILDSDGTMHHFSINRDGFYIIDEASVRVYRISGVRYWTEIKVPEVSTDEVLTIV